MAIIPARGGSKRIPKKNIRDFCGRPAISWAIDAARASNSVDRIFISTDDAEIEALAISQGCSSLGLRAQKWSDDYTTSSDVVRYEIKRLANYGLFPKFVCQLYATAVFASGNLIDDTLMLLKDGSQHLCFTFVAKEFEAQVQRGFQLEDGHCAAIDGDSYRKRSQDLPKVFHDAGQFYWASAESWLNKDIKFDHYSAPVVVPQNRAWDLDTEDDWLIAEILMRSKTRKSADD